MNYTRFLLEAVAVLFLVTGVVFGQGIFKNGGTFRNTGTLTVKEFQNFKVSNAGTLLNGGTVTTTTAGAGSGNLINTDGSTVHGTVQNFIGGVGNGTLVVSNDYNNGAGTTDNDTTVGVSVIQVGGGLTSSGTFTTTSGKVEYNGSGEQSVLTTTYGALVASGGNTKTFSSGTTVVNDSLRIANATTLDVSTFQLDTKGAINKVQGTGALTVSSGTVRYNGDRDQSVIPATYKTLTLTGSTSAHKKTSNGSISFAASGALTVDANDTLDVASGNLDLSTNTPTLTNSEAIKIAGNATFHGGITDAGTFVYNGTGTQTLGAVTYTDLILRESGAKNFPSGTVAVTGNYTIISGAGARDYDNGTFQFAGSSGTQAISGLDSESLNILEFTAGAAKTLAGTTLSAVDVNILATSGTVTNNVTTFSIGTGGLSIASGTELVNSSGKTVAISGGDLENDGTLTNSGTITIE